VKIGQLPEGYEGGETVPLKKTAKRKEVSMKKGEGTVSVGKKRGKNMRKREVGSLVFGVRPPHF